MDFLKRWSAQIQEQLRQLNVSQKLLIGTVLILTAMVLFLVAHYAAKPEMVPLLDQSMDPGERARIVTYLEALGMEYQEMGDRVMVQPQQRVTLISRLKMQQLLPEDTSRGFDALAKEQTWWKSNEDNRRLYLIAKQQVLADVLEAMDWVADAKVIIGEPERPAIGRAHVRPTAAVHVITKGERLDQMKVNAVAGLVSGAVAEMRPEDVTVIDGSQGREWRVRGPEDMLPADYLQTVHTTETALRDKITTVLGNIRGLIVGVNVELDMARTRTQSTTFDRDKSVELLTRERSSTTTTTDRRSGGEPGVASNVGATIAGGGTSGTQSSTEETESQFEPHAGKSEQLTINTPGQPTRINATIRVPRSYFVGIFNRGKGPDAPEPTDEAMAELVKDRLDRFRRQVTPLTKAKSDGELVVDVYDDFDPTGGQEAGPQEAGIGSVLFAGGAGKTLGLGALALCSVGLMLWMVRKASRTPDMPDVRELAGIPAMPEDEEDATQVVLTGVEVDEQQLRNQHIVTQLGQLIREKPEDVSTLLNRWLQNEE